MEVHQRTKKSKTETLQHQQQSDNYEKPKENHDKTKESHDKVKEMIKTSTPEKVPIPLLLIVIIMNFIITSSSSDLGADHLDQELLYQDICYS